MCIKSQCEYVMKNGKKCGRFIKGETCWQHSNNNDKRVNFEKPEDCPVCYETMDDQKSSLPCGHWVHRDCVRKSGKAECPICRKRLNIRVDNIEITDNIEPDFNQILDIFSRDNIDSGLFDSIVDSINPQMQGGRNVVLVRIRRVLET